MSVILKEVVDKPQGCGDDGRKWMLFQIENGVVPIMVSAEHVDLHANEIDEHAGGVADDMMSTKDRKQMPEIVVRNRLRVEPEDVRDILTRSGRSCDAIRNGRSTVVQNMADRCRCEAESKYVCRVE